MKKLILLVCFLVISSAAFAQLRMDENFSYTAGDSLGQASPYANGWIPNSGGGLNPIMVTSPGLVYAGYPLSGIGNAITLSNTGQDKLKAYLPDSIKTGSVYASFMIRVDTARTGDYFLAHLQTGSGTNYEGRVLVRSIDGSGNISFGITKGNAASDTTVAGIWTPHSYTLGTTYLVVLKYTFVPGGSTNDQVSLFVLESGLPSSEPAPTVGPITYGSNDATSMGRIGIRQGTNFRAPNAVVDGIRVSTSWFSTLLEVKYAVQGIVNLSTGNTHTVQDSATVNIRNSASPYAIIATAYGVINPATLTVSFELSNSIASGSYYLEMAYRKSAEFRNGINTWGSGNQNIAPYSGGTYNFTSAASQAFGDNEILIGTVYASYNGDIYPQDGTIDAGDLAAVENAVGIGLEGYTSEDVTGDDFVDGGDLAQVENNVGFGISEITP